MYYPDKVHKKSGKKVCWLCPFCEQEWEAIATSTYKGSGCPVCSENTAKPGWNDLETANPKLAKEWHSEKMVT